MATLFRSAPQRVHVARLDIGQLLVRERACLRLLYRSEAATASQLATLLCWSRWNAHYRLRRLWRLGLLERAALQPERGGVPIAYRLTHRARQRLGYTDWRPRGIAHLRHTLDTVETVCVLARHGLLQAWMAESMCGKLLEGIRPDSAVALQAASGSGAVCLEIDEATERISVVRAKLNAYAQALPSRPTWKLLFVVNDPMRAEWLGRVAGHHGAARLRDRSWVVVLDDLRRLGTSASVRPVGWRSASGSLSALLDDPSPRRSRTPVPSEEWVRLLGSGGGEDFAVTLA